MQYKNTEIKLNVLVNYFNEGRINLAPVFQRGRAWKIKMRQGIGPNGTGVVVSCPECQAKLEFCSKEEFEAQKKNAEAS